MTKKIKYIRKRTELFRLIEKIKLWPSRSGVLHGVRTVEIHGRFARITTHCNKSFDAENSRNSRAARWLRSKMFISSCPHCSIPDWKLEKFGATRFSKHQGTRLSNV